MRKSVVGVALLVALGACSAQTTGAPTPNASGQPVVATDAVQLAALAKTSTAKTSTVKIDATVDAAGQHVTMTGQGRFGDDAAGMAMHLGTAAGSMEMRLVDKALYLKPPAAPPADQVTDAATLKH